MNTHTALSAHTYAEVIEEIRKMMIAETAAPGNMMDPSYFRFHLAIVERYALELAPVFGARQELVRIAALIHDISAIRDYDHLAQHHILGAEIAKKILEDRIPAEECETIADAIRNHNAPVRNASSEAAALSHADALSKFDSPVYWISYAFKRKFSTLDESICWYKNLLSTTYAMMDPRVQKMTEDRYSGVRMLLAGLDKQ